MTKSVPGPRSTALIETEPLLVKRGHASKNKPKGGSDGGSSSGSNRPKDAGGQSSSASVSAAPKPASTAPVSAPPDQKSASHKGQDQNEQDPGEAGPADSQMQAPDDNVSTEASTLHGVTPEDSGTSSTIPSDVTTVTNGSSFKPNDVPLIGATMGTIIPDSPTGNGLPKVQTSGDTEPEKSTGNIDVDIKQEIANALNGAGPVLLEPINKTPVA
jgi:hypothetical protein